MAIHRLPDLQLGGVLRRRQQVRSLDDHAVLAITALRHLQLDPGLLQRMDRGRCTRRAALLRPESRKALERRDRLAADCGNRTDTTPDLLPVQQHRASATLGKTAAEARAVQVELV